MRGSASTRISLRTALCLSLLVALGLVVAGSAGAVTITTWVGGKAAVEEKDQARACALVHQYGTMNLAARPMFDLLLRYAVSEDGALHAEKYYRTVMEEFTAARPAYRWRQLVALARVTASEYGRPAPGMAEARELLKAAI